MRMLKNSIKDEYMIILDKAFAIASLMEGLENANIEIPQEKMDIITGLIIDYGRRPIEQEEDEVEE